MITASEIAEMELRLKDITAGQWTMRDGSDQVEIDAKNGESRLGYAQWNSLVQVFGSEDNPAKGMQIARANAKFIIKAADDMRRLISEIKLLQDRINASPQADQKNRTQITKSDCNKSFVSATGKTPRKCCCEMDNPDGFRG